MQKHPGLSVSKNSPVIPSQCALLRGNPVNRSENKRNAVQKLRDCQKVNCPEGAREATLGCGGLCPPRNDALFDSLRARCKKFCNAPKSIQSSRRDTITAAQAAISHSRRLYFTWRKPYFTRRQAYFIGAAAFCNSSFFCIHIWLSKRHHDVLFSGSLCGEANQVTLERNPCTGAAFAAGAQDL